LKIRVICKVQSLRVMTAAMVGGLLLRQHLEVKKVGNKGRC